MPFQASFKLNIYHFFSFYVILSFLDDILLNSAVVSLCFKLDELSRPIGSTKSFQTAFLPYLVMMIEKLFPCHSVLKVSKFQNELLKSSFLANMNEILTDFLSYFGKNDDFINSF